MARLGEKRTDLCWAFQVESSHCGVSSNSTATRPFPPFSDDLLSPESRQVPSATKTIVVFPVQDLQSKN